MVIWAYNKGLNSFKLKNILKIILGEITPQINNLPHIDIHISIYLYTSILVNYLTN